MVRRKNTLPKGSFLHRRSRIHTDFSHIAHKRRNARFNGLWWVNTPPQPLNAHTAAYTPKHRASLLSLHGGLSLISHLGKQKPEEADARLRRVSASSGVAALLSCVIFFAFAEIVALCPVLRAFRVCERGGGITTLGALCVLLKCSVPACQSGYLPFSGVR